MSILFAQPLILLFLPRTYWRFYKNVLNPEEKDKYITGFSKKTAVVFPWYLRVAECVNKYGRRGYVYEDGLGFSLKERFWLNPTALKIYNNLKVRKYALLTSLILLSSIFFIGILEGIEVTRLGILIILIGGSSLFLLPFFRLSKPEILSWAFFPLAFYSFLKGYFVVSIILCSVISILNFTVTLLILETILIWSLVFSNLIEGIFVSIIPLTKLFFDFIPFLKRSFAKGLIEILGGGRKTKTRSKEFLRVRPNDIYLSFFYLAFVGSFLIEKAPTLYILLLLNPLFLFVINQNFFRVADNHTFYRFFFVISTVFFIIYPTPLTFLAYLVLIYISSVGLFETVEDIISQYPHLVPCSVENSNKFLKNLFNQIPNNSRIVFEVEDTEREMMGFLVAFYYFEYLFLERGIEFLPMEWLRLTQMNYFVKDYVKINKNSKKEVLEDELKELGAGFIMVYSNNFSDKLEKWGYKKVWKIEWKKLKELLWNFEEVPQKDLHLFQVPFLTSLIEPRVALKKEENRIEFKAKKDEKYIIKYNYHPCWKAYQNGMEIKIEKLKGKISYIFLESKEDGKVEIKFNTNRLK